MCKTEKHIWQYFAHSWSKVEHPDSVHADLSQLSNVPRGAVPALASAHCPWPAERSQGVCWYHPPPSALMAEWWGQAVGWHGQVPAGIWRDSAFVPLELSVSCVLVFLYQKTNYYLGFWIVEIYFYAFCTK